MAYFDNNFNIVNFDTSNVTDMSYMFRNTSGVENWEVSLDEALRLHNKMLNVLDGSEVGVTTGVDYITTASYAPSSKIIYIHRTSCPSCGGLLDGAEDQPYTYCVHCGAKVWSEREVNIN